MWTIMCPIHVMDRIDFCREFKKSPGKHDSWSILKEVPPHSNYSIPPHSNDRSLVIAILHADSGSFQVWRHFFFIDRGDTYLNKIIKKCWLRFTNDLLIYCSTENVVQRELLPGHFWTFLHTSNYARKQVLNAGSSDWVYSKYGCEFKLLQILVTSLKISLKGFFSSIFIYKVCLLWLSDQDSKDPLLHSILKPFSSKAHIIYHSFFSITIM